MSGINKNLKVAIVHYWLDNYRGGEKVIEALCEIYPYADIYTHIYKPVNLPDTITSHNVYTSFISKLPFAKKFYRHYLLLMPLALRLLNLKKYDLIISSESGPAKGVRKRKDALHICYCHSPMRYIWDMESEYLEELRGKRKELSVTQDKKKLESRILYFGSLISDLRNVVYRLWSTVSCFALCCLWRAIACYMRSWDRRSARKVDYFIANSKFVAARIRKFYNRKSTIIHPPVNVGKFDPILQRKDFYLCVSQLVSYKKVELVVKAFNMLGLPLCVIGVGGGGSIDTQSPVYPNNSFNDPQKIESSLFFGDYTIKNSDL